MTVKIQLLAPAKLGIHVTKMFPFHVGGFSSEFKILQKVK